MACGFFRAMSYDFANHHIIASVDGVRAVIDSMKRNTKNYDVLKEGCYFLQNILCNPEITPETIECVLCTIPIIIDALCETIDDAEYRGAACGVLASLAIDESAREHIARYDLSVPMLLSVLGPGIDMDTCKYSLNTLSFLATVNDDTKAKIAKLQGIRTVLEFLTPLNDVVLLDSGMRLLAELTRNNKENTQLLLDEGGFEFVRTTMENNSGSSHLQGRAFAVLRNLAILDFESAVSLILNMMSSHKKDSLVQFGTCQALLQYCCHFPSTTKLLQSERGGEILALSQFLLPFSN